MPRPTRSGAISTASTQRPSRSSRTNRRPRGPLDFDHAAWAEPQSLTPESPANWEEPNETDPSRPHIRRVGARRNNDWIRRARARRRYEGDRLPDAKPQPSLLALSLERHRVGSQEGGLLLHGARLQQ